VKDEGPYLREWIEYHRLVGVEHFYLYDNGSSDSTTRIMDEYRRRRLVTWRPWPERPGQLSAYKDALAAYGNESFWMAFIDVDEFIVPAVGDSLVDVVRAYEEFPALVVFWLLFGTSYFKARPPGLQIENFVWRAVDDCPLHGIYKSIIQPVRASSHGGNPHSFRFADGYAVTEGKVPVDSLANGPVWPFTHAKIRINHYFTRSEEEWGRKVRRGRVSTTDPNRQLDEEAFVAHNRNETMDLAIGRFSERLRRALRANSQGDFE
jgi:hypothetical protein